MGLLPKLQKPKMEIGEDDAVEKRKSAPPIRGHIAEDLHIYKIVIIGCRITKMPLLGLKCRPFHLTWK